MSSTPHSILTTSIIIFLRSDRIDNTVSDVYKMVSDSFKTYDHRGIIGTHVNVTVALGKTREMTCDQLLFLNVHSFLQGDKSGQMFSVKILKSVLGYVEHLHDALTHRRDLALRFFRKVYFLPIISIPISWKFSA